MMQPYISPILVGLLAIVLCGSANADDVIQLQNAGFEQIINGNQPVGWNAEGEVFSIDSRHSHTGRASLKIENKNPEMYQLCTQKVQLDHGQLYRLSAWVKTKDSRLGGAHIAVEWYDANHRFIGGSYVTSLKSPDKWVEVRTDAFMLPKNAVSATIACYLTQGATGTAWFDDLKLTQLPMPLFRQIVLRRPSYRGRVMRNQGPIELMGWTSQWADDKAAEVALTLVNGNNHVVASTRRQCGGNSEFDLTIPIESLNSGRYHLYFSSTAGSSGAAEYLRSWSIDILTGNELKPAVYIDEHHRVIVDGKPMLPIGLYTHMQSEGRSREVEEAADLLKGTSFNCLIVYGQPNRQALRHAQQAGIYMIPSIIGRKDYDAHSQSKRGNWIDKNPVAALQNEPALLAWYINDESGTDQIPHMKRQYLWTRQLDPNHPILSVTDKPNIANQYLETFDIVGCDPYPLPTHPIADVSRKMQALMEQVAFARPVWQVVQAFNWKNYAHQDGATPSPIELRNMIWQNLTHGANGIILYSLYDIQGRSQQKGRIVWQGGNPDHPYETYWPQVKKIAKEVAQWAPILLSTESSPKVEAVKSADAAWLGLRTATWDGRTFTFAVNNTEESHPVDFRTTAKISHVRTIKIANKDRQENIQAHNNQWRDIFKPLEVRIYELNGKGERLPPSQDMHPPEVEKSLP